MLVCVYAQITHKKLQVVVYAKKIFASLRLRKNLVELRARLSLLVDKTTFQHSVLTIYYATIDGHALDAPDHPPPAPAAVAEGDALDVPDHLPAPARRGGMDALDVPDHLPAPAAMAEGDALDAPDHPPPAPDAGKQEAGGHVPACFLRLFNFRTCLTRMHY